MTRVPYQPGRWDVLDGDTRCIVTIDVDGGAHCLACRSGDCPHTRHVRRLHADPGMTAVDTILQCIATDDVPDGLTFQAYIHRVCTEAAGIAATRDRANLHTQFLADMTPAELETHAAAVFDNRSHRR